MGEQISFSDRVRQDLIFLDIPGDTKEEVLKNIADRLVAKGIVKESYYQALMEREREYPTGLPLGGINVAIPHTYPQHVLENTVIVAVPRHPIQFCSMEDPSVMLDVSVLVCPTLIKMEDNIKLLPSMIRFFVDQGVLEQILAARAPEDVMHLVDRAS